MEPLLSDLVFLAPRRTISAWCLVMLAALGRDLRMVPPRSNGLDVIHLPYEVAILSRLSLPLPVVGS